LISKDDEWMAHVFEEILAEKAFPRFVLGLNTGLLRRTIDA
jgi:hypothetical protein